MPLMLRCDRVLIWVILALALFGLMMVYSTTATAGGGYLHVAKHLVAATIGFAAMYGLIFFDYRRLRNPTIVYSVLGVSIALLLVASVIGTGARTQRFLRLGILSLQPSELAKPAVILFLAYYLERNRHRVGHFSTLLVPLAVVGTLASLILLGRDFGTMACLAILAGAVLYMGRTPVRFMLLSVLPAIPVLFVTVWLVDYRRQRLLAFLSPESDPLGSGFQILQSEIALGSGGLFGQGWMVGRQKMQFLPEAHTDFIFAMVGEEHGLIGTVLIVVAFCLILQRGLRAAEGAPDLFGALVAGGITVMIVSQAMLNIGVVLGLLPTKGMPLPLISYGGTSLMTVLACSGVLLNISRFGRSQ